MSVKETLLCALDTDKEEHIRLLQSFVQKPSPNPPGGTAAAAGVLTTFLRSKNIPFELITPNKPDEPNIVSEFSGGKGPGPRVVLNGHIDVFPVGDGDRWTRPPYSGDIEDGRIYGRGVVDMKSGTASLIIAYAYLYQIRESLRGSVAFCAVSDEETGGKWGTKYLIHKDRARWGGDVMLGAEPTGCSSVRFAEKGTLRLSGTVTTKGAHGAYINLSKGAIRTATEFFTDVIKEVEAMHVDVPEDMAEQLKRPEVLAAIDRAMGEGTSKIISRPTVNIGTIKGGVKVNMIPSRCNFELDIRLPVGLTREQVLRVIDSITSRYADAKIEISPQEAASNPASVSPVGHPIVSLIEENAEHISPDWGRPVAIPSMGATDSKHYRYAGIPAYQYGCSPVSSKSICRSHIHLQATDTVDSGISR